MNLRIIIESSINVLTFTDNVVLLVGNKEYLQELSYLLIQQTAPWCENKLR